MKINSTEKTCSKLRLLLFEECHRNCEGCCNKDWNLQSLPVCDNFRGYDLIMLTGGEPMLHPELILDAVNKIRLQTNVPIILYTALLADKAALCQILELINGVTVTLHTAEDIASFLEFVRHFSGHAEMSCRLNIFRGVGPVDCSARWKVKDGITWIKDCPLPSGETLMRFGTAGK